MGGISAVYIIELPLGKVGRRVCCQRKQARPHIKPVVCSTGEVESYPRVDRYAALHQSWPAGLSLKTPHQRMRKEAWRAKEGYITQQEFLAIAAPGILWQRDGCQNRQTTKRPQRVQLFNFLNRHMHFKSRKSDYLTDVPVKIFNLYKKNNKRYKLCSPMI